MSAVTSWQYDYDHYRMHLALRLRAYGSSSSRKNNCCSRGAGNRAHGWGSKLADAEQSGQSVTYITWPKMAADEPITSSNFQLDFKAKRRLEFQNHINNLWSVGPSRPDAPFRSYWSRSHRRNELCTIAMSLCNDLATTFLADALLPSTPDKI